MPCRFFSPKSCAFAAPGSAAITTSKATLAASTRQRRLHADIQKRSTSIPQLASFLFLFGRFFLVVVVLLHLRQLQRIGPYHLVLGPALIADHHVALFDLLFIEVESGFTFQGKSSNPSKGSNKS